MPIFSEDLCSARGAPSLDSINFLNEVIDRYPRVISSAPGAPHPTTFEQIDASRYIDRHVRHLRESEGLDGRQVRQQLYQYGPSRGIISALLAQALAKDEGIPKDEGERNGIRLSCSFLTQSEIEEGPGRLAEFLRNLPRQDAQQ